MGSDGSHPRRLTNHSAGDEHPTWSPDGRHIAFESERDGNEEIYVMGSDGSNPRRLTYHSARPGLPLGPRMAATSPSRPTATATLRFT